MDNKDKIIQEQREEICLLNEEIKRLQLLLSQAGIPYGKGIQEKERPNSGNKHLRDAVFGWYRYDSRFALPVYDEQGVVERYNVYHVSMLVRHAKNGNYYLYDILDIKKETSNPFRF